jgi:acyl carrier protein
MSESFTAVETGSVMSSSASEDAPESDVMQRIRTIVVNSLDVRAEEVTADASFIEDLGADSLDVVDLAIRFENAFQISIKDKDYPYLTRLCDAAAYIEARLSGATTDGATVTA